MRSVCRFADETALCLSSHSYQRVVVRIGGQRACGVGNYGGLVIERSFHAEANLYLLCAYEKGCVHVVRGKHRLGAVCPTDFEPVVRFRGKQAGMPVWRQTWKSMFPRKRSA